MGCARAGRNWAIRKAIPPRRRAMAAEPNVAELLRMNSYAYNIYCYSLASPVDSATSSHMRVLDNFGVCEY